MSLDRVSRDVISDEARAVIGPLFPKVKSTGRPPVDRRTVVEATAWRFRTGAPWRIAHFIVNTTGFVAGAGSLASLACVSTS
ncbi:transposase [Kocuria sp. CPCC 205261]|uniref:transposase n=1 Tax=Kocuria TaxID=57493 RepID=UPI0034D4882A